MKRIVNIIASVMLVLVYSCNPQEDSVGDIGPAPSNGKITVDASDVYNPVFTASADHGFVYHWDMGNNQTIEGKTVTAYYPFTGDYNVVCTIYGEGGQGVVASTIYTISQTDPNISNRPGWKELTGGGQGKTWVYNTVITGDDYYPDYCFQTYNDTTYDYGDGSRCWDPKNSWGQCVGITPDVNGEMVFDLNGGVNYIYHHVAGDEGVKGSFILDWTNRTLTVKDPFILDYNIECTEPSVTMSGVYNIMRLTDDEMILWQMQTDIDWGTGWAWSFKRKGYTPK